MNKLTKKQFIDLVREIRTAAHLCGAKRAAHWLDVILFPLVKFNRPGLSNSEKARLQRAAGLIKRFDREQPVELFTFKKGN
jgi:hypothetical protein